MCMKKSFTSSGTVWKYPGVAAWYFFSFNKTVSADIKKTQEGKQRRGWGSIPVEVAVGKSVWRTSIFPDKDKTYLLPLKAQIRKKEGIYDGDTVKCTITLV